MVKKYFQRLFNCCGDRWG